MYIVFAIAEVAIAIFLGVRITKMSPTTARFCYLLYTFLTGLTFSSSATSFAFSLII